MIRARLFLSALASPLLLACADRTTPTAPAAPSASLAVTSPWLSPAASFLVRVRDDCDPASFNAALGPGACVGDGKTTFGAFIAELEATQQAAKWRNGPRTFSVPVGTTLDVVNLGGEVHTFTPVAAFGGGIVKVLNDLSGVRGVVPECRNLAPGDFVPHGGHISIPTSGATVGPQNYMCCIHPWMKSTGNLTAPTT